MSSITSHSTRGIDIDVAQTVEYFLIGREPINTGAINQLHQAFRYKFAKEPQVIRLSVEAVRQINSLNPINFSANKEHIMGMKIEVCPNLGPGGWRIGTSEENISRMAF